MTDRLVLSVAEAAEALGVSDDLVYELTQRGELPCLRFGRRKVIPRRAIELLVEAAVADFDLDGVLTSLGGRTEPVSSNGTDPADAVAPATETADSPALWGVCSPGPPEHRPPARRRRQQGEHARGHETTQRRRAEVAAPRLFD
jgi:excisionase family DNA binding protein